MFSGCSLELVREDREFIERESGVEVEVEIRLECAREFKIGCREGGIEFVRRGYGV